MFQVAVWHCETISVNESEIVSVSEDHQGRIFSCLTKSGKTIQFLPDDSAAIVIGEDATNGGAPAAPSKQFTGPWSVTSPIKPALIRQKVSVWHCGILIFQETVEGMKVSEEVSGRNFRTLTAFNNTKKFRIRLGSALVVAADV